MRLSIRQYATILDKALAAADTEHAKEKVMNEFAALLIEEGRTSRLGEILELWKNLYNKRHGLLDVEIKTADKEEVSFPHSFAGKKVAFKTSVDPSLIGGSIIKIGDYVIDGSIKLKIEAIRQ
ncbi:MAG: F0F1 ATP synthase subunit delta [Candidatus Paceibacterota bacterium]|jgi:F-type H+-transporting ATPase subunit delta